MNLKNLSIVISLGVCAAFLVLPPDLDSQPHDTRVLELPGADFTSYRWGNTVEPITAPKAMSWFREREYHTMTESSIETTA